MDTLFITNELREKLKEPVGRAILGKEDEVVRKFNKVLEKKAYRKLIAVGDVTSRLFDADVKIFDGRILRNTPVSTPCPTMTAKNPPASIDGGVWDVLKKALLSPRKERILIDGEEDLLVLPLVSLSCADTIIVYGLPHEGICYVVPDSETKRVVRDIMARMRPRRFRKVALGGTFDHLHDGHKYLLFMSKYYAEKTYVGIASEEMAKKKPYSWKIQGFDKRKKAVEDYSKKTGLDYSVVEIRDVCGPAIEDEELDSIILTDESFENGRMINNRRKENGLKELDYIVLPYVLGSDGKKMGSTSLRI